MQSDDRREYVRRNEDVASHADLAAQVKEVRRELEDHFHPEIHRIIDVLEGPCVEHLDGRIERDSAEGMVARQERIENLLENGVRVRYSLSGRDVAQIVAATLGGLATVVAAWIAIGGPTP